MINYHSRESIGFEVRGYYDNESANFGRKFEHRDQVLLRLNDAVSEINVGVPFIRNLAIHCKIGAKETLRKTIALNLF